MGGRLRSVPRALAWGSGWWAGEEASFQWLRLGLALVAPGPPWGRLEAPSVLRISQAEPPGLRIGICAPNWASDRSSGGSAPS